MWGKKTARNQSPVPNESGTFKGVEFGLKTEVNNETNLIYTEL